MIDCETDTATRTASPAGTSLRCEKKYSCDEPSTKHTPPAPVMPAILRGKAVQQAIHKNMEASTLEEPEERSLDSGHKYDSDPEVQKSEV